ncbi:MAG: OsmC family protein [Candidatus Acidiferrales bacterium]
MGKLIQTSKVKIHKEPGNSKIKRAEFEGFPGAVRMGIHGGIAQYFKLSPDEPMASTLDYIVAAVGGCLTGTVAGALEARGVRSDSEKLQVEAEGRIEDVDGKMILTGIKMRYRLTVPKDKRAAVERALQHHEGMCAASESVRRGITVEWESEIVEESENGTDKSVVAGKTAESVAPGKD